MAFAFARHRFFGREVVNFAVTLPIILPGVITGVALASFFLFTGTDLSTRTVIIGHTTFCIVLVFNNVLARLRRLSPSIEEASRDLGASGFQTFRYVTLPSIRTALVAGALLSLRALVRRDRGHVLPRRRRHDDAAALDPGRLPQQPERPGGERRRDRDPADLAADDRARRLPDARGGIHAGRSGVIETEPGGFAILPPVNPACATPPGARKESIYAPSQEPLAGYGTRSGARAGPAGSGQRRIAQGVQEDVHHRQVQGRAEAEPLVQGRLPVR